MKTGFYSRTFSALKCLTIIAVLLCVTPRAQAQYIPIDTGFAEILMSKPWASGCIVNYQLDTACAKAAIFTDLSCKPITGMPATQACRSLEGLQYLGKGSEGNAVNTTLTIDLPQLNYLPALPSIYDTISIDTAYNLTQLPPWSDSVKSIRCYYLGVASMPAFPSSLLFFSYVGTSLTSLPDFPPLLEELQLYRCTQLVGLPTLNNALKTILIQESGLTSLPALPSSLTTLICSGALLTTLPALNNGLVTLRTADCNLNSLPALPSSLRSLEVMGNNLTIIPPLPEGLKQLLVYQNQLTVLPALPDSLEYLWCMNNDIDSLPILLNTKLISLRCKWNRLTALPQLPNTLQVLDGGFNKLTAIPPIPAGLKNLSVDSNLLSWLPTLSDSLLVLSASLNNISTLPQLPGKLRDLQVGRNPISCLPYLPTGLLSLGIAITQITCLPNRPVGINSMLPICDDSSGCIYNGIGGRVYFDQNNNCVLDSADIPLRNRILKLDSHGYTMTDTSGFYRFMADSGNHTVTAMNFQYPYIFNCTGSVLSITYTGGDGIENLDFPVEVADNCTNLFVDISAAFIRLTAFNIHHAYVSNLGSDTALNAYVEVKLDPELIPLSCTLPYVLLGNNTMRIGVGDVAPFEEIRFSIVDSASINAMVGQTACVKANVFPKGNCMPTPVQWDSSHLTVQSMWLPGEPEISFKVTNTGKPMSDSTEFRIYEEELLMLRGRIMLAGLDSFIATVPANGHTYRMEADQHPFHPGFSKPRDFMELAGTPPYVIRHIVPVPQDDDDEWVEIDCHEIVASMDPNEKQVFPSGVGVNHYITATDELEYILHFQNTGNDTAFNIRLIDTLSTSVLDATTFKSGVSSHPYTVSMRGNGIVEWKFANIMLVDSTTNEPGSHGFVKFKIKQVAGNVPGTVINNFVDIYFDYNEPVRTNTAFVTIEEKENIFPVSVIAIKPETGFSIRVMPNPFADNANFEIATENTNHEQYTFELFDMLGRTLINKPVSNRFTLNRGDINAGVYMFRITTSGKLIGTGKVVAR